MILYAGRRREPRGWVLVWFFWCWWGIFLFVFFTKPRDRGQDKPCKCAAMPLQAPVCPSGMLPGDTDEILRASTWLPKMPLKSPGREERCGAGGGIQQTDSTTLKKQPKVMVPSVPTPVTQQDHLTPSQIAWDGVHRYFKSISSFFTEMYKITPNPHLQSTFKSLTI